MTSTATRPPSSPRPASPTYDLDGNQTSVLTETGVWQVAYNAENRPVRADCKQSRTLF